VQRDVALGISSSRSNSTCTTWLLWEDFCRSLTLDPTGADIPDPIPLLQVFAHRYRTGEISPSQSAVRGHTVGDALRAIGQTMAHMGFDDPHLQPFGKLDLRLSRLLSAYNKADPPPARVKPIPLTLIRHTCALQCQSTHPLGHAIADMLTLGFFYLLRPGEYAHTDNPDSAPFRLQDVHLMVGCRRLAHCLCPFHELYATTFACLEFTTQKNGVRGEMIGLCRLGNATFCPVTAIINRVVHLCQHRAQPDVPLYSYYHHRWCLLFSTILTNTLQQSASILGPTLGLSPSDISIRSLECLRISNKYVIRYLLENDISRPLCIS